RRPCSRPPTSRACPRARRPSATSSSKPAPRASRSSQPAAPAPPSCSTARSPPWSSTTPRTWTRSRTRWRAPSAPNTTLSRKPPARAPRTSPGTSTSTASRRYWPRWPMADSATATGPPTTSVPDLAKSEPRYLRRGSLQAWVAPGVDLERAIAADGDPDHLLMRPDCRIVKLQRKVVVGRVETSAGALWVKRYAVFAWRVALASLGRTSPAFGAWAGARALAAHGFATPEPIAAIEFRRAGLPRRSFLVTREVAGAVTADVRWRSILADPDARRRRAARRALACAPGDLFRHLH